ncbi:MAG: ABC transporter permease [Rhodospirillaceae bacterium]
MSRLLRAAVTVFGLLVLWHLAYELVGRQPYLLPSPWQTAQVLVARADLIARHAWVTGLEIILGLIAGTVLGSVSAVALASFRPARQWLMPLLVVSQAIPVFAIAPLLVLWLGYGLGSKVAMATLIIYFPVTAALFDGLRRTDPGWLDLAGVMGGNRWRTLRYIRLPAALPAFASGLRVATAVAPIGAIVGEWVGSAAGLGYLMLHANARMQVDLMFAALFVLAVFAVLLYAGVDAVLHRALPWQPDATPPDP